MSQQNLNIILNGNIVKGFSGETILTLAKRNGIEIPTLCHDDRLEPFSSCYLCVVEVEGMRGHQPACSTLLTEGMKIITDNTEIRKSRKMALELILSNHYADCLGPCKQTCPAGVDVQGYISLIDKGMYIDAVALIKQTNPLPAICGRVCVRPCEAACRRNLLDEGAPVGIDYMKRFAADYDLQSENKFRPVKKPFTGKKIAVIGAGPGGLSAAWFLQIEGHQVDIYEAAPKSGGWLRYGIPEYRLPNDILDQEVKNITDLGTEIFYNQRLGGNLSYKYIKDNYQAAILAIGSQKGTGVGCEGDDAGNVFSGIDFLKNMEVTGQHHDFKGKTIAVVGGGNTAMDCCRTSIRCNADKVYVIYRRTEKEMPANPIEIHESKLEGVEYLFLTLPKKINKNDKGDVESVTCIKMELGEPDASGRRRPVPVEGSDFTLKVDFILAAIGQKTEVNFIEDINRFAAPDALVINKWGDIDANPKTLQTGIPSVFAAGDGVTGPATIIEAIAQAKTAALSAHQFVMGLPVEPAPKPFTSKKDNFRKQESEVYIGSVAVQKREEMPVLAADQRMNFNEVELGYENEGIARKEAQRCLECGCNAFFNCDLQKYATEYLADQKTFSGEFFDYQVDFRHPFIEIDNNKCILCARCVRICREVAGANALGLVNRGFKTFVAPSMGLSLQETPCESCGLCISACPTGAISENVPFKPGPLNLSSHQSVCNYCSVGCTISLEGKNGFIMGVEGANGIVNQDGNICRFPRFGYRNRLTMNRITKPLLKKDGEFTEISFAEAYKIIADKIKSVSPDENAFFGGARLTNEELYLIHKLARGAAKTNQVGSFHYLGRGEGYRANCEFNMPLEQFDSVSDVVIVGTEINFDHPVVGYMIRKNQFSRKIPVHYVTDKSGDTMTEKVDFQHKVKSYFYFFKALNHYIIANKLTNPLFIRDRIRDYEKYEKAVLEENFTEQLEKSGLDESAIRDFAVNYCNSMNTVIVFSEKTLTSGTAKEIFNLARITGKIGKTASGVVALKESCNSQGLFDMGVSPHAGIGGQSLTDEDYLEKLREKWSLNEGLPTDYQCLYDLLKVKGIENIFIFGEDPVGCAVNREEIEKLLLKRNFMVVQDYNMTETAKMADLLLPASFPDEIGGSFTNSQKTIQEFNGVNNSGIEHDSYHQLSGILKIFGFSVHSTAAEIFMEIVPLLPETIESDDIYMNFTSRDNDTLLFTYGCDSFTRDFEDHLVSMLN